MEPDRQVRFRKSRHTLSCCILPPVNDKHRAYPEMSPPNSVRTDEGPLDFHESYSHNFAQITLEDLGVLQVVRKSVVAPEIDIYRGTARTVRKHIQDFLTARGWISELKVDPVSRPSINFSDPDSRVLYQIETGDNERTFYDLMKMQAIFEQGRCTCAVICLPSADAAKTMGSNITHLDKVRDELEYLFSSQIVVPVYLLSYE